MGPRAHWLIETSAFPETAPRITAALDTATRSWSRYADGMSPAELPPDGACVLFWGSLGCAYRERVAARWRPGAIGDVERFRCTAYLPALAPVLANADAIVTTVRALVERPVEVLGPLAGAERVFVRPDSAEKPFSGRVVALAGLTAAALDHGFYYDDLDLAVLVAPAWQVAREWRFVVAEGVVVAGCEYGAERRARGHDVLDGARALATEVAHAPWQAAPLYVVDIAEVDDALAVMELNPFSGADLYACDPRAVIGAASSVAERLFVSSRA